MSPSASASSSTQGGSIEELEDCARGRHVTALYALDDGEYISYILEAPESVNQPFVELFADGVPPVTPLTVRSDGPPSADPNPGAGDIVEPGQDCMSGDIVEGFSLVVYEGGSVENLWACARSRGATALYTLDGGEFVSLILNAPDFVNEPFVELFPGGLAPVTPLIVRSN